MNITDALTNALDELARVKAQLKKLTKELDLADKDHGEYAGWAAKEISAQIADRKRLKAQRDKLLEAAKRAVGWWDGYDGCRLYRDCRIELQNAIEEAKDYDK